MKRFVKAPQKQNKQLMYSHGPQWTLVLGRFRSVVADDDYFVSQCVFGQSACQQTVEVNGWNRGYLLDRNRDAILWI